MSNDLERYSGGGDLAPYSPGGVDLFTPSAEDNWGVEPDYLDSRGVQPSTDPQLAEVHREIGITIAADLQRLGHPQAWVNAAQAWYAANIGKELGRVQRRHSFNLHAHAGDALAESFGNAMARAGVNQEFVSNALWLLEEMVRRLTAGNGVPAHAGAPTTGSAEAILDSLDDRTYDYVVRHNETVKSQTEAYLRSKWRDSYEQNVATAAAYLAQLPASHRAHFDAFEPGTWTLALNSATTVEGLFKQSLGGALPSGAALATEIMQLEDYMRRDRRAYNKNLQAQSRLRTLYELRGS